MVRPGLVLLVCPLKKLDILGQGGDPSLRLSECERALVCTGIQDLHHTEFFAVLIRNVRLKDSG